MYLPFPHTYTDDLLTAEDFELCPNVLDDTGTCMHSQEAGCGRREWMIEVDHTAQQLEVVRPQYVCESTGADTQVAAIGQRDETLLQASNRTEQQGCGGRLPDPGQ